jgi:hypothetical protein
MTLLAVLVVLAVVFGAGAVLEGVAWMFLIALAVVAAASGSVGGSFEASRAPRESETFAVSAPQVDGSEGLGA